ncbi:MAG TPA: phosphatase PAP2 family protein, partial [Ktedonobacteraceae bacterium]|nr:phosphatase PAP2 family protein [Ktedonobacteraceae bacterium]
HDITERKSRDDKDDTTNNPLQEAAQPLKEAAQDLIVQARKEVETTRLPWYRVVRGARILLIVDIVLLALFSLLTWWVHLHPVLSLDVTITREFQENQSAWLKYFMMAVSFQGYNLWFNVSLIAIAAVVFWVVDLRLEAIVLVLLTCVSAVLNVVIKILVDRPRPSARLVDIIQGAGGPSFPSGHVMSYVAFWGLLFSFGIILFSGTRWWRITLMIVSGLIVALVGPSRIYLGDHWASDVLGAYLIGFALLIVTLWIFLLLKQRGVLAPRRQHSWYRHTRS